MHVDVLIVGAGLSGIGAAAQLTRELPDKSYLILEGRSVSGGTWDLFRYPGIRSDSDMYTMGYRFKPWPGDKSLAAGDTILDYVRETAREYDVDRHIRFGHRVVRVSWSSETSLWTVEAERDDGPVVFTASFLWSCSGYYDYEGGHRPAWAGEDDFAGPIVHPQQWPQDLVWADKRVVVIGSGATAVTLVPAMADQAAHVTMLQRSPSYVLTMPQVDKVALALRRRLPPGTAHRLTRWKNVTMATFLYKLSRRRPDLVRRMIRKGAVKQLPEGYDVDTHFNPAYDPWDQRLCLVPDGDLFGAIRRGRAEVVTATIERFDRTGILLSDGRHLDADVVVAATGLSLLPFGGIELVVDGEVVEAPQTMAYRALMLSGVPNFVFTVGYTNASWTLKADLVAEFVTRLLAHLDAQGHRSVRPVRDATVGELPFMDFQAGYVLRALDRMPKQGDREPWQLRQDYRRDIRTIRRGELDDGVLAYE